MSAPTDRTDAAPRRRYHSTRRAMQAAQTRRDVLDAAVHLFTAEGWTGTTITGVAAAAGVSPETIYSGFGSKKALLREAIDVAVVGDAEPVPFVERDTFASLGRGTFVERVQAVGRVQAEIHERSAGVWRAIMEAAAADPDVDAWRVELERGRRIDTGRGAAAVLGHEVDERTIDVIWALLGPEVYLKLTGDAGYTRADYEDYVRDVFVRVVR